MRVIKLKDALDRGRFDLAACLLVFALLKVNMAAAMPPADSAAPANDPEPGYAAPREAVHVR